MPAALYHAFITGSAGSNIVLLYIDDKVIAGVDAGAGQYRGTVQHLPSGGLRARLEIVATPGNPLLTGGVAPVGMPPISFEVELPPGFGDGRQTILINTPLGPVNARFEKSIDI